MKKIVALALVLTAGAFGAGYATAAAAAVKTYQVTGPVIEARSDAIVVKKGTDNWEIARDATTKLTGSEPKAGDKVTVTYRMTATGIEAKPAAAKAPAKKK
ncbi:MAG TPA: hypothetical protein VGI12_01310 [Vicinamibacterales bacterium]